MAKKALAYLRVSGLGQVKGDGFPRQTAAIAKYAKANGLAVLETFKDEGASGTIELADRLGLAKLLDRIETNGVKTVLIERADRLARDLMLSEVILGQFRDLNVTVIEDSATFCRRSIAESWIGLIPWFRQLTFCIDWDSAFFIWRGARCA